MSHKQKNLQPHNYDKITTIQASLILGLGVFVLTLTATAAALSRRGFDRGPLVVVSDQDLPPTLAPAQSPTRTESALTDEVQHDRQIRRGRLVYQIHCLRCHGSEGRGDGPSATALDPAPGDLAGSWSTAKDPESVRQLIVEGIPGTAMPGIGPSLSSRELEALTAFVLGLANQPDDAGSSPTSQLDDRMSDWQSAGFQAEPAPRKAPPLALIGQETNTPRSLDELRGRWVLVHFWGTTCGHCLEELPAIGHFIEELNDEGPAVLNLCIDTEDPAEAARVAQGRSPNLEVVVDPSGLAARRYGVNLLPATVLIDPGGRLVGRRIGALDWSSISTTTMLEGTIKDMDGASQTPGGLNLSLPAQGEFR